MSPGISPSSSQPEHLGGAATPNMSTPLSSPPSPRTEMANQINEEIIAQQNEELPPDEVPSKQVPAFTQLTSRESAKIECSAPITLRLSQHKGSARGGQNKRSPYRSE